MNYLMEQEKKVQIQTKSSKNEMNDEQFILITYGPTDQGIYYLINTLISQSLQVGLTNYDSHDIFSQTKSSKNQMIDEQIILITYGPTESENNYLINTLTAGSQQAGSTNYDSTIREVKQPQTQNGDFQLIDIAGIEDTQLQITNQEIYTMIGLQLIRQGLDNQRETVDAILVFESLNGDSLQLLKTLWNGAELFGSSFTRSVIVVVTKQGDEIIKEGRRMDPGFFPPKKKLLIKFQSSEVRQYEGMQQNIKWKREILILNKTTQILWIRQSRFQVIEQDHNLRNRYNCNQSTSKIRISAPKTRLRLDNLVEAMILQPNMTKAGIFKDVNSDSELAPLGVQTMKLTFVDRNLQFIIIIIPC